MAKTFFYGLILKEQQQNLILRYEGKGQSIRKKIENNFRFPNMF